MAVISPVIVTNNPPGDGSIITYSWTMVTANDTGAPVPFAQWADRSVQFAGTWGGGTIVWEGSNDGTNYETLTDAQTNAITKTANALEQVIEATLWARPRVTVSVTSVVITLLARRNNPQRT
jgi:hypothetical protein